jgi:hypothetical protein
MTIETVYGTNDYEYCFDTLAGVGWYVRKHDDHVSYINTGHEAVQEKESFERLLNTPLDTLMFDDVASRQTYTPRWA